LAASGSILLAVSWQAEFADRSVFHQVESFNYLATVLGTEHKNHQLRHDLTLVLRKKRLTAADLCDSGE
jgi:hypothetical protein